MEVAYDSTVELEQQVVMIHNHFEISQNTQNDQTCTTALTSDII